MAQAEGFPKALLALFSVCLLLHALPEHVHGHAYSGANLDIVKMLFKSRKYESVTHLFRVAGLAEMLTTADGPLTFFLPTDIYYGRNIDKRLLQWLLEPKNKESLQRVLLFHITHNKYTFRNFTNPPVTFPSLEGSDLHVRLAMKNNLERLVVEESPLRLTDSIVAKDGAVHGIDGFLVPPYVIPSVLCPVLNICEPPPATPMPAPSPGPNPAPSPPSSPGPSAPGPLPGHLTVIQALILANYTDLATALVQTELDKLVNSASAITILAPSNDAFKLFLSSITPDEANQLPKLLKWILLYHVLPAYYTTGDLDKLSYSQTFYKPSGVTFSSNGKTLLINPTTSAAKFITPNILLNGDASVQGIDKVLVPLGIFTGAPTEAPAPSPADAPAPVPEASPPTSAGTHLTSSLGILLASSMSLLALLL